jgi:hypothetical protein
MIWGLYLAKTSFALNICSDVLWVSSRAPILRSTSRAVYIVVHRSRVRVMKKMCLLCVRDE